MQNKHVTFEEIYDILAVRIIYKPKSPDEEINNCFQIYVAISQIYKSHPDRLRDWVNHPKANGYQALHVTLMSFQRSLDRGSDTFWAHERISWTGICSTLEI